MNEAIIFIGGLSVGLMIGILTVAWLILREQSK